MRVQFIILFLLCSIHLVFAQAIKSEKKNDSYLIYKKLSLDKGEKMMFEESFDLEKEAALWIKSRRKLKLKMKELLELKNVNTSQIENQQEKINDKSYDIDEYYEIINETRKKIYLKYLKLKKKTKLSADKQNEINKLIKQAESFFERGEEIRKRAYKQKEFTQICMALNNSVDFENMGIKKLEKALKILLKL